MIYWIDWPYWIWKTSFAVNYALEFSKKYKDKWIVISNIRLYWKEFENYIFFDYSNILDVVRFANHINDIERKQRSNYSTLANWKRELKRQNFTKFLIIFDESWSLLNKHEKKTYESALIQYINQTRKIFYDMFLTSVLWWENFKQLRDKVEVWYTMEQPFPKFPILHWLRKVYREFREPDGYTVRTEKFIWKDIKWDRVLKERPLKFSYKYFYKPWTYYYYDDLHKNIDDPEIPDISSIIQNIEVPDQILKKFKLK